LGALQKVGFEVRITAKAGRNVFLIYLSDLGLVCPKGNTVVRKNDASPEELPRKNGGSDGSRRSYTVRDVAKKHAVQGTRPDCNC
jgi:hypothetical protein